MFKHILIATDGSELAQKAVDQGLALAKALGAKATAVTVTPPWTTVAPEQAAFSLSVEEYERCVAENAAAILAPIAASAKAMGVACDTRHVPNLFPAEGVVSAATELGCDVIVMASHGRRGVKRLLLGSQAFEVVTHATIPVLVCR
jgi:nucleotide-binding universal stress UspA family protein